ncbi:MAG: divalent-cation tolerance protein CutA [Alphaproteobacteria bacterium]|jgi:periplasmic divalent cation tolerance protein|nr:divalent-cation tolerance protein CutA [Alphaproteobacteria bacterium]MDP6815023.1 divalent-cation tolerance protein CutA [Alphaproteobacteria bacterium]|tara:strand:- start:371 stop:688 length:318 start_codon:yes stop_codon:yes gene_type:complete
MEELTLLYVTCADGDEAKRIARGLLADRLVACANVLSPHTAIYRWQGEVQEDAEVGMLLKTRRDLTVPVAERIKAMHSYDLPCVVSLPIHGGSADFLAWLHAEVG